MKHAVDDEFRGVCARILAENRTLAEWAKMESDDMLQTPHYEGGFDATEGEFCFSLYRDGQEYWFQVSMEDVKRIFDRHLQTIDVRQAE